MKPSKLAKSLLFYFIMVLLCLEIAFRLTGYQPFINEDYKIRAQPSNAFVGHSRLGIQLQAGEYVVTLNDSLQFRTRHTDQQTRYVPGAPDTTLAEILMLGCSYTYGFGVHDEECFTTLLQKEHPKLKFYNLGVIGHGTVQSSMQLRKWLDKRKPQAVILTFSSYHFMRNTLSPQYRSNLKIGYNRSSNTVDNQMSTAQFPFLSSCNDTIQHAAWETIYQPWLGREWFASVNFLQTNYDLYKADFANQIAVTACLIEEMAELCESKGISFGLACLDAGPGTTQLKAKLADIPWIDVGFDFSNKTLINYPYDEHPNKNGHQLIAKHVQVLLQSLLFSD